MGEFLKSKIGQERYDAVIAYLYNSAASSEAGGGGPQ